MLVVGNIPPELAKREVVLMTRVLKDADATRGIKSTQQAVDRVAQLAFASMSQEELLAFADESVRLGSPPALTCSAAIKFFAGLNAIPVEEQVRSFRVLYSAGD